MSCCTPKIVTQTVENDVDISAIVQNPVIPPADENDTTMFLDPLNPPCIAVIHEADPVAKTHVWHKTQGWRTHNSVLPQNS